jgi:hypothetical protein
LVSGMKETTGCSKEKGMIYVQWLWASGWKPSVGGVGFFCVVMLLVLLAFDRHLASVVNPYLVSNAPTHVFIEYYLRPTSWSAWSSGWTGWFVELNTYSIRFCRPPPHFSSPLFCLYARELHWTS